MSNIFRKLITVCGYYELCLLKVKRCTLRQTQGDKKTPTNSIICGNYLLVVRLIQRREGDSNPRYSIPYDSLANCWFQPLTHLSNCADKSSAFYYSCKLLACFFSIFSRSTGKNSPTNNYFCTGEGPFPIFFHN